MDQPVGQDSPAAAAQPFALKNHVRVVTAASLFDGHDVAINIMRRLLQSLGAEVIHLGHNRSVDEVVTAAIQEDVQAIAISSYQGGHVEYFTFMVDSLRQRGAGHIKVFGGGGGVITAQEIAALHDHGVERIYSPYDGQDLGLKGMIADLLARADFDLGKQLPKDLKGLASGDERDLTRLITGLEANTVSKKLVKGINELAEARRVPVIGVTGTGGAGKSSLTDELIRRFRHGAPGISIAVIAVDPSKRKSGGALLGDRIRMNSIYGGDVFLRSLATRGSEREIADSVPGAIAAAKAAGHDLVIVETSGIGQGDAAIVPHADAAIYVMTPEFGAASQLEKIDMLDFADLVVINKFDRHGAEDALRDVRKQVQRSREAFDRDAAAMPVYGTVAANFNDDGVTALYCALLRLLSEKGFSAWQPGSDVPEGKVSTARAPVVPPGRRRHLAEAAQAVHDYRRRAREQSDIAGDLQHLRAARRMLGGQEAEALGVLIADKESALEPDSLALLEEWPDIAAGYRVDGDGGAPEAASRSLSGTLIPKVALPRYSSDGDLLRWLMLENLPGSFPFTAGVFPFKRGDEDPTRMFAGEGDPARTNQRFKMLSKDSPAKRLSTAFDSVTLYGFDPDERPDIYGKVGNSGVSVATLDDMKALYEGFDLCHPATSVSMTINGPAPTILAMFLNTAIDQKLAAQEAETGKAADAATRRAITADALEAVRGTVQADILKEDQGQNTCIFSTEFSLRMMGDIQEYFVHKKIRNFYSVSISGYHIAEAGANPVSQLAFTLANGLTYVEAYLARGMKVDDFAPNLSFFFSSGMDPEYTVLGRVARRVWAVILRDLYGASERSQKLKYHIQTSGRSLHAQEMDFNDIRTTLQALVALYDHCNSLHTNAHDEAFTTPTSPSVRRALAIQHIINKEWGLSKNQNPNQGAFIIDDLTDLLEEAVLAEFERLAERGGVLGAMETGYQRGKIQDESLHYETLKHDGTLPIVGVNTFLPPDGPDEAEPKHLQRSTVEEKDSQIKRLRDFKKRHEAAAPEQLARLKAAAAAGENVFAVLMDAVRCCTLGQITEAFFEVGGQYRRNM